MPSTFGAMLAHLIERKGLTKAAFARAVGLSPQAINHFVRGTAPMPLRHVEGFADVLQLEAREREVFVLEAHLTHATQLVRDEVNRLQRSEGGRGEKAKG